MRPHLLPLIVFAQFAGTSLWFAGNAVLPDLQATYGWSLRALGQLTSAVQLGFIAGTLLFAVLTIADRFSPVGVFLVCAQMGALANGLALLFPGQLMVLLVLRLLTGFFLAGIYPVGMKIASDWYREGLGLALGYLVGALVLGTAFPHLLQALSGELSWQFVFLFTSGLSVLGGGLLYFGVGDGPNRKRGSQFSPRAIAEIFRYPNFRSAALGYFGHMWELYAFWAFVPVLLKSIAPGMSLLAGGISLWSFVIIALGGIGCVWGGYRSLRIGSARVANGMLIASGICCFLTPIVLYLEWWQLALPLWIVWGFSVVGDSPQFSTLVARTAPSDYVGSALTIVNSIGFAITIGSITLLALTVPLGAWAYWLLLPGPVLGWRAMQRLVKIVS